LSSGDYVVNGPRSGSFFTDTSLPAGFYQVHPSDYTNTGYDRGHMCPSADRTDNTTDNNLVFLMTNIIPQDPNENQGIWGNFEDYCRSLISTQELLITCGPRNFGTTTIASGHVYIPSNTWKVVVCAPLGSGTAFSRLTNATAASIRVIAVDIPSGLDTDRGTPLGVAVQAEMTVALGFPKIGEVIYPGLNFVGELVVAKNRLGVMAAVSDDAALAEVSDRISRLVSGMQGEVIASRMTPVGEVFERFPRLVRDLARDLGKRIRFDVEGEEIELDRSILDEIGDPLLHLIRNAADHGIESPEARLAAGKPEEGRILLAAARERNSVTLRVSDDGRGIDRAAILTKARREDAVETAGDVLTDDVLLRVLARPGFSTAQAVSGVSGRGVGVDVAMTRVRALGGTLEIRSEVGKGTSFLIRVPLTLAIVRALLADAGGERYAVPLAYVAETVEFDPRAVTALRSREALVVREQVIPTVHLRDLVASRARPAPTRRPTVILEVGERRTALVVDALLGQQDIVVAPFDAPRGMPPYVGGATILADGAPALVLDAAALL